MSRQYERGLRLGDIAVMSAGLFGGLFTGFALGFLIWHLI